MRRLVLPLLLMAATIAAFVGSRRLAQEELPEPVAGETVAGPVTPVFSIRRAPDLLTGDQASESLARRLDTWIDEALEPNIAPESRFCLTVNSGNDTVYNHNGELSLSPASNLKILTAAAALMELTPEYRFTTSVYALRKPDDTGVLDGDLYLVGGGDPILATQAYQETAGEEDSEITTDPREIANSLLSLYSLNTLNGGVQVIDDRYDAERAVPTWAERFLADGVVGVLGALVIDDGYTGWPAAYPQPDSGVTPTRGEDPGLQAGAIFDDLLEANGVLVAGSPARPDPPPDLDTLVELTSVQSPPLTEIVEQMLSSSDNTTAELLLKEIGYVRAESGSTLEGAVAVTGILGDANLDATELLVVDGSGLSLESKASCALISETLRYAPVRPILRDSMAVAAESGTLVDDFVDTSAAGRIRAKTGFISTVIALSGYATTTQGSELVFSFILNAAPGSEFDEELANQLYEGLGEILMTYPEGPPLAALGPVAVDGQTGGERDDDAEEAAGTTPTPTPTSTAATDPEATEEPAGGGDTTSDG